MARILSFLLILFIVSWLNNAEAKSKMKKFENPAHQFIGSWRVEAYDFREFIEVPTDLDSQLKDKAASFPVGQMLEIDWHGTVVMPGTFNTETSKFEGPVGEELSIKFMTPLEKKLCTGYWNSVCGSDSSEYVKNFMIVEIYRWDAQDVRIAKMWTDVKHMTYSFVSLNKQHSFSVWVTKKGKLILPIFINGKSKVGKPFGEMGVILTRVDARHK